MRQSAGRRLLAWEGTANKSSRQASAKGGRGAHLDLDRIVEDGACEHLHLARERRGEEHCLPVGPDLRQKPVDLRLKAHVKHTVCFVDDQHRDAPQVGDGAVGGDEDIDHAAWGADNHIDAALQLVDLVLYLRAAVRGAASQVERLGKELHLAADLHAGAFFLRVRRNLSVLAVPCRTRRRLSVPVRVRCVTEIVSFWQRGALQPGEARPAFASLQRGPHLLDESAGWRHEFADWRLARQVQRCAHLRFGRARMSLTGARTEGDSWAERVLEVDNSSDEACVNVT